MGRISSLLAEDVTVALPINRHSTSWKRNSSTALQQPWWNHPSQ